MDRLKDIPKTIEEMREVRRKFNKLVDKRELGKLTFKRFLELSKPLEERGKQLRKSIGITDKSVDERHGGLFGIYTEHNGIKGRWHNGA